MTNKIDEIIAFLTTKETSAATAEGTVAENPETLLEEVEKHLAEIHQLFISSFQLQCLSSGIINSAAIFTALSSLQSRLTTLVAPYANNEKAEIKYIINKISKLIPKIGQEGKYVYESTKLALWNSRISQRISIPQGFATVIDIVNLAAVSVPNVTLAVPIDTDADVSGEVADIATSSTSTEYNLKNFTFLTTHGIGPCVGFILYSEKTQRIALAHFDDPFSATRTRPDPEKLSAAQFHYQACITGILTQAQVGLPDPSPDDWKVILASSGMRESEKLCEILTQACTTSGIRKENIIPSKWEETGRSILIKLQPFNMRALLTYEETVQIAAFPKESLTLRQALNLPPAGLSLFRMVRGLVLCDAEQGCYIDNDYVTTSAPNLQLANRYFVATGSHKPISAELEAEVDNAVRASKESAAVVASSTNPTAQASDTTISAAASPAEPIAPLPERSGLNVAGLDTTEHSLLAAANHGRGLEAATTLVAAIVSTLVPVSTDIHPAIYATAVAASAVVALATSSMATATIAAANPYYIAIAALAAITAAEKITVAASQRQAMRARGGARSRGLLSGPWGARTGTRSRGATTMMGEPVVTPGELKRTAADPPPEETVQAPKRRRIAFTSHAADTLENKSESAVTVEHEATLPGLTTPTPTSTAPIIEPISIPAYLTTFIVDRLVNTILSTYAATNTGETATASAEHHLPPIMEVSLSLIRALVAAASARMAATTEANSSIVSTRPSLVDAVQAIISLSNSSIPAEELAAAMYIVKSAATAVYAAPAAGAAVTKPVSFLWQQVGTAATSEHHLSSSTSGPANPALGDDIERKADDDGKTKPEQ